MITESHKRHTTAEVGLVFVGAFAAPLAICVLANERGGVVVPTGRAGALHVAKVFCGVWHCMFVGVKLRRLACFCACHALVGVDDFARHILGKLMMGMQSASLTRLITQAITRGISKL